MYNVYIYIYIYICNLYIDILYYIISYLQDGFAKLFQWFSENQIKENTDKYHLQ